MKNLPALVAYCGRSVRENLKEPEMSAPSSTEHPITFPTSETWRDNPRLASGRSIQAFLDASKAKEATK